MSPGRGAGRAALTGWKDGRVDIGVVRQPQDRPYLGQWRGSARAGDGLHGQRPVP